MILSSFGREVSLDELRALSEQNRFGHKLSHILEIANGFGLGATAVRASVEDLQKLQTPALLHWDMSHFVVLQKATRRRLRILDPALGARWVSYQAASKSFTGVAAEFVRLDTFTASGQQNKRSILGSVGKVRGIRVLGALLIPITLLLLLLSLVSPLFLKVLVDEIVAKGSYELLHVIVASFILIGLLSALTQYSRAILLVRLSSDLNRQTKNAFVRHLFGLESRFFQMRRASDIGTRIDSVDAINQFISYRTIEILIDVGMSVFGTIMLLTLGAKLGITLIVALGLIVILRTTFNHKLRDLSRAELIADTDQKASLIETIGFIERLRATGGVGRRAEIWASKNLFALTARANKERVLARQSAIEAAIRGAEYPIWGLVAILGVIDGSVSLGAVYAALAYKAIVFNQGLALISAAQELSLLSVHRERISDVTDQRVPAQAANVSWKNSRIEIEQLDFTYAKDERPIFSGANLVVDEGEFAVLLGHSGSGKSTLMRLILGSLEPMSGKVEVAGTAATLIPSSRFSHRVTGILQNDTSLFEGSIAENISLFDSDVDLNWIEECCKVAALGEFVKDLPGGIRTVIASPEQLSGGQLQRLMIARALYHKPSVLILDEPTANLDSTTAKSLIGNLQMLDVTILMSTHRDDSYSMADTVYKIQGAKILQ